MEPDTTVYGCKFVIWDEENKNCVLADRTNWGFSNRCAYNPKVDCAGEIIAKAFTKLGDWLGKLR